MKKLFTLISINFIILTFTYFTCEYICFLYELYRAKPCIVGEKVPFTDFAKQKQHFFWEKMCVNFDKEYLKLPFRKISGKEYTNKKPIVLFGCSFVWGTGLKQNQTFSAKLSDYIKRKVYNRAIQGWGPQDMLYQVKRQDLYSIIKEEPEIIIYTFITDHTTRVYREVWGFEIQTFYKRAGNDELKESFFRSGNLIYGYTARQIRRILANKETLSEKSPNFVIQHFTEAKKEMQKHWKNTRYCIFVYHCNDFERKYLERLKEYGFEVIFSDELTNENLNLDKYHISEYDMHPSALAWDLLIPLLTQKLKLE